MRSGIGKWYNGSDPGDGTCYWNALYLHGYSDEWGGYEYVIGRLEFGDSGGGAGEDRPWL